MVHHCVHWIHFLPCPSNLDTYRGLANVQPMFRKLDLVPDAIRVTHARCSRHNGQHVLNPCGHHQHTVDANRGRGSQSTYCGLKDVLLPANGYHSLRKCKTQLMRAHLDIE